MHHHKKNLSVDNIACRLMLLALAITVIGLDSLTSAQDPQRFSEWSAPVNLGPPVNTTFAEIAPFISRDGLSLYHVRTAAAGGFGGEDLWVSERATTTDAWGPPQNLGATINTSFNDFGPSLSPDGHSLYFASSRPGFGGIDLWASRRHNKREDFGWQPPVNLGSGVNTAANELQAAHFEDDVTGITSLYFASNRLGGPGGDDIYVSTLLPDETFGTAELVAELSTPATDIQPNIRHDGLELFLASSRPGTPTTRPPVGETVTTASGLSYVFTKHGTGTRPQPGDLLVIHGIGRFPDGKEFWNTRTEGTPYEYTPGVDRVIRGFEEGMRDVREGDRIVITMKPELAYGERGNRDIPPNATLVFDYEILAVESLSIARLVREGIDAGTLDIALTRARGLSSLREHYVSVASIRSLASTANRRKAGDGEKVLVFGLTLLPDAHLLHQALAREQSQRGAVADAIRSYEAALRLNPKNTDAERREHEAATKALADLRGQQPGPATAVFETEKGTIEIEVDTNRAPITGANILRYVEGGSTRENPPVKVLKAYRR